MRVLILLMALYCVGCGKAPEPAEPIFPKVSQMLYPCGIPLQKEQDGVHTAIGASMQLPGSPTDGTRLPDGAYHSTLIPGCCFQVTGATVSTCP